MKFSIADGKCAGREMRWGCWRWLENRLTWIVKTLIARISLKNSHGRAVLLGAIVSPRRVGWPRILAAHPFDLLSRHCRYLALPPCRIDRADRRYAALQELAAFSESWSDVDNIASRTRSCYIWSKPIQIVSYRVSLGIYDPVQLLLLVSQAHSTKIVRA